MLWSDHGKLVATLACHTARVTSCLIFPVSSRGEWSLTVSADKTGIIWSREGQMLGYLPGHAGKINTCAMFQDGERVLTVADDHTGLIWPAQLLVNTNVGKG